MGSFLNGLADNAAVMLAKFSVIFAGGMCFSVGCCDGCVGSCVAGRGALG